MSRQKAPEERAYLEHSVAPGGVGVGASLPRGSEIVAVGDQLQNILVIIFRRINYTLPLDCYFRAKIKFIYSIKSA